PAILGPSADTIKGFAFDPTRAKQVLDQAGWKAGDGRIRTKGGRRLELTMIVGFPNADIHGLMPEAVKAMLADVGIDLKVVTAPDENAYSDRLAQGAGEPFARGGKQRDANAW